MSLPNVTFPVVCPVCRLESLIELPISIVTEGLKDGSLKLVGHCQHPAWRATTLEREQIREYLTVPILEQQLGVSRTTFPAGR
jgi:hypothetical protein